MLERIKISALSQSTPLESQPPKFLQKRTMSKNPNFPEALGCADLKQGPWVRRLPSLRWVQFVGQAGSTAAVTCIELVPTKHTLQQPSKEGTSIYSYKFIFLVSTNLHPYCKSHWSLCHTSTTYFSPFVFFHFPELLPEIERTTTAYNDPLSGLIKSFFARFMWFMPPTSPRAPRVCLGFSISNPWTHDWKIEKKQQLSSELQTHGNSSNDKSRSPNPKTAALVVARFATNLVDAQGAEAAIVHEPIEVLIWSGETVELMRDDLIQFISKGKKQETSSE